MFPLLPRFFGLGFLDYLAGLLWALLGVVDEEYELAPELAQVVSVVVDVVAHGDSFR